MGLLYLKSKEKKTEDIGEFEHFSSNTERFDKKKRIWILIFGVSLLIIILVIGLIIENGELGDAANNIIITEVVTSNNGSLVDDLYGTPDWIELYNGSDKEINLAGYSILSGKNRDKSYSFSDLSIPARTFIVVYATDQVKEQAGKPCLGFSLSKKGETLHLTDKKGQKLQSIDIPMLCNDVSYALRVDSTWGYCLRPTPSGANTSDIDTMGHYAALVREAKLIITEVMPDPSDGDDWIELYNAGDKAINLYLFSLSDDKSDAKCFHLPDLELDAGAYVLIHASGAGNRLDASFRLGENDKGVYLFDITGNMSSSLVWDRFPQGDIAVVSDNTYTLFATPGESNSMEVFDYSDCRAMDSSDPVKINEVLLENTYSITDARGNRCAWTELYNSSQKAVTLKGYYLSDDETNLFKWALPKETISAGEYVVIFLSGDSEATDSLHTSFKISKDEDALFLTDISSMHTDKFMLPEERTDNVSIGRSEDGAMILYPNPTPYSENSVGFPEFSLLTESRTLGLYISEVSASGSDDWVELYNGSERDIDLKSHHISDDVDNIKKWQIPYAKIPAGGYFVIDASVLLDEAASFGIAAEGETIAISDEYGEIIDVFKTGQQCSGTTSGRIEGDSSMRCTYFTSATKNSANIADAAIGCASPPFFSETSLYHTAAFELCLSTVTENAMIYYTLDGSAPDDSDNRYTGALSIENNSVVRAVVYADGFLCSDIVTATYLFDEKHTVPVFCLSGEPEEMKKIFDKASRNYKPEYAANIEYHETDGALGISFCAGLKPKGRSSLDYAQKSVTIKAKSCYGRDEFVYPFFDDGGVTNFTSITLRNGGQDILGSRLRDSFIQTLAQGLNVDGIRTKLVVVYVNGQYWGVYDLNEEQEDGYFEAYYNVREDSIDLIERNATVLEGSARAFIDVRNFAKTQDMSDDSVFADFKEMVDVDSCMDYLITNIYFGNGDMMNQRFWCSQDGSVPWRPLLFDLDWTMRFNQADRNKFRTYFSRNGSAAGNDTITETEIFYGLLQNDGWRDEFINRFIQAAYMDFDTERLLELFDETVLVMEPEMARHIERWDTHRNVEGWRAQTDLLRKALDRRRDIVLFQMARFFGISNAELKTLTGQYKKES